MSLYLASLTQSAAAFTTDVTKKLGLKRGGRKMDMSTMILFAAALLFISSPFELTELVFALVGALIFVAFQGSTKATRSRLQKNAVLKEHKCDSEPYPSKAWQPRNSSVNRTASPPKEREDKVGKQEVWRPSVQPVFAPTFEADSFENQVQELVKQLAPCAEGDKVVQAITAIVKKMLHPLFPEADVVGFASANVVQGSAFAVAIPEIDVVLSAPPSMLAECLQRRTTSPSLRGPGLDARAVQKAALRACTDDLVIAEGFKFRRSAFKGSEPKVTVLAPTSMGVHSSPIPLNFSVNTVTPFYSVALLTECGKFDPRAKELILLVRRWAKDRGISHAAKGHLSPYLWTLLVVYFLQVHEVDCGPLLPALTQFKAFSKLLQGFQKREHQPQKAMGSAKQAQGPRGPHSGQNSTAVLFEEFLAFYRTSFNCHKEVVSVHAGQRDVPSALLRVVGACSAEVAPCIEDPFDPKANLSNHMTSVAVGRLFEELRRAGEMLARRSTLTDILEPWTPDPNATAGDC